MGNLPVGYFFVDITWPDGETNVTMVSRDKEELRDFIYSYAHDAGTITVLKSNGNGFDEVPDDDIWKELEFPDEHS